jgi:hypothetical protein
LISAGNQFEFYDGNKVRSLLAQCTAAAENPVDAAAAENPLDAAAAVNEPAASTVRGHGQRAGRGYIGAGRVGVGAAVATKNQTKKKICLLFVVVAKELGVANEQALVA